VMEQVAAQIAENGDENTAQWLSNLSRQLVARLGNPSTSSTPEAYFNFLMETLQKISGSSVCVMQWTEVIRDGNLI